MNPSIPLLKAIYCKTFSASINRPLKSKNLGLSGVLNAQYTPQTLYAYPTNVIYCQYFEISLKYKVMIRYTIESIHYHTVTTFACYFVYMNSNI